MLAVVAMARRFVDYTGKTFGVWNVGQYLYNKNNRQVYRCCDLFGNEMAISSKSFTSSGAHFQHPDSIKKHRKLRAVYDAMCSRCYDSKDKSYKNYGAKGIEVCEEWLGHGGFRNFLIWALRIGWSEGLYVDRINNDAGYLPSNCRWVTAKESGQHRRPVKLDYEKAEQLREERSLYKGSTATFCRKKGEALGVCSGTIQQLLANRSWT
jgi:hypothetical protein